MPLLRNAAAILIYRSLAPAVSKILFSPVRRLTPINRYFYGRYNFKDKLSRIHSFCCSKSKGIVRCSEKNSRVHQTLLVVIIILLFTMGLLENTGTNQFDKTSINLEHEG